MVAESEGRAWAAHIICPPRGHAVGEYGRNQEDGLVADAHRMMHRVRVRPEAEVGQDEAGGYYYQSRLARVGRVFGEFLLKSISTVRSISRLHR